MFVVSALVGGDGEVDDRAQTARRAQKPTRAASESTVPVVPVAAEPPPKPQWIDLLESIDPQRNTVGGQWHVTADGAVCTATTDGNASLLVPPVKMPTDYELEVELTVSGDHSATVALPINDTFAALVFVHFGNTTYGLEFIDGRNILSPENPTTGMGHPLLDGQRHVLRIEVQSLGFMDQVTIAARLDGNDLFGWIGRPAQLTLPNHWRPPEVGSLALGAIVKSEGTVTFHRARVRTLDGSALAAGGSIEGWRDLLDGATLNGWHSQGDAWSVDGGAIHYTGVGNGYLISDEAFDDFELQFEWKAAKGSNSGVFYRAPDSGDGQIIANALEYQVVDNIEHPNGAAPNTAAGSIYGIVGPQDDVTQPADQWNSGRIIAIGNHVEHWVNDVKVAEVELHSPQWKQLLADGPLARFPDLAQRGSGHIALQALSSPVWYRNIRIRQIAPADTSFNLLVNKNHEAQWQELFNGSTLGGWVANGSRWKVEDGAIVKTTEPGGWLYSAQEYDDFDFQFEWKLERGSNSGVFYRAPPHYVAGLDRIAPEYELITDEGLPEDDPLYRRSGALYGVIGSDRIVVNPPGEWNRGRILAVGPHVEHWLNGTKLFEIDIGSGRWHELLNGGPFARSALLGSALKGNIVMQGFESGKVSFRNLRIRRMSAVDAADEPIDLLPLIDAATVPESATWEQEDGSLTATATSRPIVPLPVMVDGEYELELRLRQHDAQVLNIGLPVAGSYAILVLHYNPQGSVYYSGLEMIDGADVAAQVTGGTGTATTASLLADDREQPVKVRVTRANRGDANITVEVDGAVVIDWTGAPQRLAPPPFWQTQIQQRQRPALIASVGDRTDASVRLLGARLNLLSGKALITSTPESTHRLERKPQEAPPVDVLKLVDLNRDSVSGQWDIDGAGALVTPLDERARLRLPIEIDRAYRLSAVVNHVAGDESFDLGLVMGDRQCLLSLDGYGGQHISGLSNVSGLGAAINQTRRDGPLLRDGRQHIIECTVRDGHIFVEVDNYTVLDWRGDADDLSLPDGYAIPSPQLFLSSSESVYRINAVAYAALSVDTVAADESVNVLSLINLNRDVVRGAWRLENGALVIDKTEEGVPSPTLRLPIDVSGPYQLHLQMQRLSPGIPMSVVLPLTSGEGVMASFDAYGAESLTGLADVDGKGLPENETRLVGVRFPRNQSSTIVISVRPNRVSALWDGDPVIDFDDPARLSLRWGWSSWSVEKPSILLTPYAGGFRITGIQYKTLPQHESVRLDAPVDLLRLIDPARDTVAGDWRMEDGALLSPPHGAARLVLPVDVPARYQIEAEAMRLGRPEGIDPAQGGSFKLGLLTGNTECSIILDGWGNQYINGIQLVDGRNTPDNDSRHDEAIFRDERPTHILVTVDDGRIIADADGRRVIDWQGDFNRLSRAPNAFLPRRALFVGSSSGVFKITRLMLKPID